MEKNMGFHRDRNDNAFEVYKKLYTEMPWELFDFDNLENDSNGYFVRLKTKDQLKEKYENLDNKKYKEMVDKYGGILCLSGDTDFGMKRNSTFDEKSYQQAKEIFSNVYDELSGQNTPDDLMYLEKNFSLLVVNGGMNCRKGFKNCFRDIFPRFLYSLSEYYEITNKDGKRKEYAENNLCKISAGGRPQNRMTKEQRETRRRELYNKFYETDIPALTGFLDTFENFEDYCIKTYFWGRRSKEIIDLLHDLKDFGKAIDNKSFYKKDNIEKYCDLAKRYWGIRNEIMDEKQVGAKM